MVTSNIDNFLLYITWKKCFRPGYGSIEWTVHLQPDMDITQQKNFKNFKKFGFFSTYMTLSLQNRDTS